MQRCYTVLKDIAFINLNAAKKRVNKNLFDAFSYTISKLNDNEYQSLLQQVRQFKENICNFLREKDSYVKENCGRLQKKLFKNDLI